jgi:hypothetical protein
MRILLIGLGMPSIGNGTGWLGGLEKGLETGELAGPEEAVVVEPVIHGTEGLGVEAVIAMSSHAMLADEAGAAEKSEMLGDGRAGDREGAGDLSGRLMAGAEEVEDGAAGRVGEGAKDDVRGICDGPVSHDA